MAIGKCGCTNFLGNDRAVVFQDKRYGKGNRVVVPKRDGGFRCTICDSNVSSSNNNNVYKKKRGKYRSGQS